MNYSAYEKTTDNAREHINFELVDTPERFRKKVDARTWKHRHVINENLESVDKLKKELKSIQPVYVRMNISDLSKLRIKSL